MDMALMSHIFHPSDIPQKPGVYLFRDRFGNAIYVGKAANLRKRLSSYFQNSRSNSADPKLRSLINSIDAFEFFEVKNESESLLLESKLIKDYCPKYNVLLRDDKRFLLLKIALNEEFPRLKLTRLRKNDSNSYFGPFPKGNVKQTVDFLTRYFGLRSCKPDIPDENDHKHCMASRIKDCSAPCIGKCSTEDYKKRVNNLISILEGNCEEIICELRKNMEVEASARKYEKAARWRDIITGLEEIFMEKKRGFRFSSIPSEAGIDAVNDLGNALGIKNPPAFIEAFDISNISGELAVGSMVCFRNGKPDRSSYRRFRIKDVKQQDDFGMIREVVSRHYRRKIDENRQMPDLILVDGGKGQLSSAIESLIELKYPPVPIIGLAKKNEEIHIPGRAESLILERQRPALKLIQAIRDEAHRFAISYHRELRDKRIQESIIDEIEGIGQNRKQQILREFGSIEKLRVATPEEIALRIPGIGIKLANAISNKLKK